MARKSMRLSKFLLAAALVGGPTLLVLGVGPEAAAAAECSSIRQCERLPSTSPSPTAATPKARTPARTTVKQSPTCITKAHCESVAQKTDQQRPKTQVAVKSDCITKRHCENVAEAKDSSVDPAKSYPRAGELQRLLNEHGYDLEVDYKFGPLTRAAVADFQASQGLEVTGEPTVSTFVALEQKEPDPVEEEVESVSVGGNDGDLSQDDVLLIQAANELRRSIAEGGQWVTDGPCLISVHRQKPGEEFGGPVGTCVHVSLDEDHSTVKAVTHAEGSVQIITYDLEPYSKRTLRRFKDQLYRADGGSTVAEYVDPGSDDQCISIRHCESIASEKDEYRQDRRTEEKSECITKRHCETVAEAKDPGVDPVDSYYRAGELQRLLNVHGYGLEVDHKVGPLTRAAVADFQAVRGLPVTGEPGVATFAALEDKELDAWIEEQAAAEARADAEAEAEGQGEQASDQVETVPSANQYWIDLQAATDRMNSDPIPFPNPDDYDWSGSPKERAEGRGDKGVEVAVWATDFCGFPVPPYDTKMKGVGVAYTALQIAKSGVQVSGPQIGVAAACTMIGEHLSAPRNETFSPIPNANGATGTACQNMGPTGVPRTRAEREVHDPDTCGRDFNQPPGDLSSGEN